MFNLASEDKSSMSPPSLFVLSPKRWASQYIELCRLVYWHLPKHIDFAFTSPFGGGRPGRVKRKRAAAANKPSGGDDEDEE